MFMTDKLTGKPGAGQPRPRSPRVPVAFAVGLKYRADSGESVESNGEAIRVSRGGATVVTEIPVKIGAIIQLTPPFGRTIDAEVNGVWVENKDGKQRIGVKLLDSNGWFAE
jgi:hypothetical protein